MTMAAVLALFLCTSAISAFQLHHGPILRLSSVYGAIGSHNASNDVDSTHASSDGTPFKLNQHRDGIEPSVVTRQAFVAKALVASSLPTLLDNAPALAYEVAAPPAGAAIYAYRSGGLPSLRPLGLTKLLTRYEGYVEAPKSYPKSQIRVAFDFPTDWLQLDRGGGGVQYVDQRNGDKLYVLHATLPEGETLKIDKQWFADVVLDPRGDVARSGVVAEGGRVSRSQYVVDCAADDAPSPCLPRRRLILKYDTVTGSGVQTVERRGLVDAYQVDNDVYMLLTTSNAVKFDKKGSPERDTVENIVSSFKIGDAAAP